jgi:hypothetical protein
MINITTPGNEESLRKWFSALLESCLLSREIGKRLLAAWVESCAFSDRMFGSVVQPTVFHFEVTIAYSAISMRPF